VLGVTATPDRQDERAMGQVFDSVAYVRDIEDGIRDGYLCPIRVRTVEVDAINLAAVRTTAGDLNAGDLDAVMRAEEALHGVARPTIELAGDRRTIVFTTSVDNAHRLAEVFERYRPGSAKAVDGGTPTDERRRILSGHKAGEYQFLVNVGVLTEGYDDPGVACVAMARPTKSRALYAQCAGRGLRIADGKADCLLLDFVGNAGRHRLVSALDILGGRYDEEVVALAEKVVREQPGMLADEALEEARRRLEEQRQREAARRARVQGEVKYRSLEVNPFAVLRVSDPGEDPWAQRFGGKVASDKQLAALQRFGMDVPLNCTAAQASRLIATAITRREKGLATFKQLKTLRKYGVTEANLYFAAANRIIDAIARNGWRSLSPAQMGAILDRGRETGEEG